MSRYELYLNLIIEMCEKLEKTSLNNLKDETVWDATLMRFQVIGENVKKIPLKLKNKYPKINWREFEWFRNQISHNYRTVLIKVIQDLIEENVIPLKNTVKKIKKEILKR